MKIDVSNYTEQEDGGSTFELELDGESLEYLVNIAVNHLIKKACDEALDETD